MGVQIPPSTQSHARRRRDTWRNWKQSTGPGDYKSLSVLSIKVGRWAHGRWGVQRKNGSSLCIITSSKVKRIKRKLTGSCGAANGSNLRDNESIVSLTEWPFGVNQVRAEIKGRGLSYYTYVLLHLFELQGQKRRDISWAPKQQWQLSVQGTRSGGGAPPGSSGVTLTRQRQSAREWRVTPPCLPGTQLKALCVRDLVLWDGSIWAHTAFSPPTNRWTNTPGNIKKLMFQNTKGDISSSSCAHRCREREGA